MIIDRELNNPVNEIDVNEEICKIQDGDGKPLENFAVFFNDEHQKAAQALIREVEETENKEAKIQFYGENA